MRCTLSSLVIVAVHCVLIFDVSASDPIRSTGEGGLWDDAATWVGGTVPGAEDDVVIAGPVDVWRGTARMLTIEEDGVLHGRSTLTSEVRVAGDIVNHGTVRHEQGTPFFTVYVSGDLANNGIWAPFQTNFDGDHRQTVALADGRVIAGLLQKQHPSGLSAATPLAFHNDWPILGWICDLDMNGHRLTVSGPGALLSSCDPFQGRGILAHVAELTGEDGGALSGYEIRGNAQITGVLSVSGVIFEDDVIVLDTLQARAGQHQTVRIRGALRNEGAIRDHPEGPQGRLKVEVDGDIINNGEWTAFETSLTGNGPRTVQARDARSRFVVEGEWVQLRGENILPELRVPTGFLVVAGDATLTLTEGTLMCHEEVENRGRVIGTIAIVDETWHHRHCMAEVTLPPDHGVDTLIIESIGHQVPRTFATAARQYWRFETRPARDVKVQLRVEINDDLLGPNVREFLHLFHSADDGQTWTETPEDRTQRETRYTYAHDSPLNGYYALAMGGSPPVWTRSSVNVNIVGHSQVRVGPPNRYLVNLYNNSDAPTDDTILALKTSGGVHIEGINTERQPGSAVFDGRTMHIDDLTMDGEDEFVLVWVHRMAPREHRWLEVMVRAVPDEDVFGANVEIAGPDAAPLVVIVAAVLAWAATGLAVDIIGDIVVNWCGDIWQPAECREGSEIIQDALVEALEKTTSEWTGGEAPLKSIIEGVRDHFIERGLGIGLGPFNLLRKLYECVMEFVEGAMEYEFENNQPCPPRAGKAPAVVTSGFTCGEPECIEQPDVYEVEVPLRKVMSWDPNEKVAPAGFGEEGFLSTAGRMDYKILFENLPEATAPAWRVIITDTLDAEVFDPETVTFGPTSHEGPEYDWQVTREGNILRWEIEDIELPPNVNPPEGEGFVTFSVDPLPGVGDGVQMRNRAEIVFDLNPPIITNTVVNTLDFSPPVTSMVPLHAEMEGPEITLEWEADDGPYGSGVHTTAIYMSVNDGPFEPHRVTRQRSITVPAQIGSRYAFYGLSRDNVGNVETVRPDVVATEVVEVVPVREEVPYAFRLHQNYPNPFNPSTVIRFSLPETSDTHLEVYDLMGRRVGTLVQGAMQAGEHEVTWHAGSVASGVYFYRLTQGERTDIRAMTVVK